MVAGTEGGRSAYWQAGSVWRLWGCSVHYCGDGYMALSICDYPTD